ncbi:hypothetical protein [Microbacterium sp.]|jgi:hypothetical protein|uniref:hypothetical protein n=1 Tax=Microbacterium sp. TaxID=51671 RepID=UPI0037CB32CD
MDDQLIDELRMLRTRAYGPDPDIHHDPSALARLQDLERLARGPEIEQLPPKPPLPPRTEPVVEVAPLLSAEPTPDGVAHDEVAADSIASESPVARAGTWSKKRIAITWLASLAVAILVTATVTGFVSRRVQADPREVAVLGIDAFAEWPGIFANYTEAGELESGLPDGGVAFQAFHGLSFFRMENGMFAYGFDQSCLLVVESAKIDSDSDGFNGAIFNGCAAGGFPATVELVVGTSNQELPEELLEAFPEGTGLQFVLEGDEVVVLSDQD